MTRRDQRGFPSSGETWNREDPIVFGDDERVRVRQRLSGRQIVDFALVHEILWDGEWRCIYRVDCAHREVHSHHFDVVGRELKRTEIQAISRVEDVSAGYAAIEGSFFDPVRMAERRRKSTDGHYH